MTSTRRIERTISLPFRFSGRGTVAEVTSLEEIWDHRVRAALLTRSGERFSRLGYGTRLAELAFDGAVANEEAIKTEVSRAFSGLLSALVLDSVEVSWDEFANQTDVSITYTLPNQDVITTTIGAIFIDGALPPYEEQL